VILYLDASALVKRYVAEPGSAEVAALIGRAQAVGTGVVSRAEVAAALAKGRAPDSSPASPRQRRCKHSTRIGST
jgi:predicted nucleic acid-binding protein